MKIDPGRISKDIEAIAAFTETPGAGCSRPTFTMQWVAARDYVIDEARRAGCHHRIDAAGNVHIRPAALPWGDSAWLSGSHLDTVPHGGKFDGVTGVVVPLEILRAASDAGVVASLEAIVFAEEEGTTFGLGMLGSRAWCGTLSTDELAAVRNRDGVDYLSAGRAWGVDPARMAVERLDPTRYRGFIEVHVEQGPAMWEQDIPVAIVTSIAGRRQYVCTIRGLANHAGSTPMGYRRDALVGAAHCVHSIEHLPAGLGSGAVATVGRMNVRPNAVNVIPDCVEFTVDLRAPTDAALVAGDGILRSLVAGVCDERKLSHHLRCTEQLPVVGMDSAVCDRLRSASATCGVGKPVETSSGALHDAAIVAPFLPTAMLFVASRDGISHNPGEFSRIDDIALAARILAEAVTG
jgi:allantoate deiminase